MPDIYKPEYPLSPETYLHSSGRVMKIVPDLVLLKFFPEIETRVPSETWRFEERNRIFTELDVKSYSDKDLKEEFESLQNVSLRTAPYFEWIVPSFGKSSFPGDSSNINFNNREFIQQVFSQHYQVIQREGNESNQAIQALFHVYAVEIAGETYLITVNSSSLVIQFLPPFRNQLIEDLEGFISTFNPQLQAIDPILDINPLKSSWLSSIGCIYVDVNISSGAANPNTNIDLIIQDLKSLQRVQTTHREQIPFTTNTPLPNTNIFHPNWNIDRLKVEDARNEISPNPGLKIAVIDSGIDHTHPDLIDNVLEGINTFDPSLGPHSIATKKQGDYFFPDPHGTQVAGIIAAKKNSPDGVFRDFCRQ